MLFSIDVKTSSKLLENPFSDTVYSAFARLLSSHLDGHHVVLMPPLLSKAVESDINFSAKERTAAQKIRNRYADFGSLPKLLSVYSEISLTGTRPERQDNVWKVPLKWLENHPLPSTNLLCEDLTDTTVVQAAAEDSLHRIGLHSFSVRTDHVPGGGANTHRVLQKIAVLDQRICFCIVDSDMHCPSSDIGQTAAPCLAMTSNGFFEVRATNGRSLENTLPWRLIDKIRPSQLIPPSQELLNFENSHAHSSRYLNLKRGINGFEILSLAKNESKIFWLAASEALIGKSSCCPADCTAIDRTKCSYDLHKGFSNSLLSEAASWLTAMPAISRAKHYLPSPNDSEWVTLGRDVASYGLGRPKQLI